MLARPSTSEEHDMTTENKGATKQRGSCHCGEVKFEVDIDLATGVGRCNCSICTKLGATGAIVKPAAFRLLAREESLGAYTWGAKVSQRFFCKRCGVYCFGRGHLPQLGGDFVSVPVNALDGVDASTLKIQYWDGRHDNWQAGPRATPWPIAVTSA
jgi:hypothetical protein